ncbi:hypothetical protein DESA109040_11845 [Deinococcus saxicola]|uniref:hypothetical protein n=1 Tax=Deinococcus saxicola TaxID=249406 RepID=UPI0039EF5D4F
MAPATLGVGFDMLDLTLNVWISGSYGHRSAAMLNLLSASFGMGAVLAPLAVGLADGDFQLPLLACGALVAALLPALLLPTGTPQVAATSPAPTCTKADANAASSRTKASFCSVHTAVNAFSPRTRSRREKTWTT